MGMNFTAPDWGESKWLELPENPLIGYENARWAIGDPQVLVPDDFDGMWHIFFHGYLGDETKLAFFHQVSKDGISWTDKNRWDDWTVGQNYMFCDGGRWIMYYTCDLRAYPELMARYNCQTMIRAKTTRDFISWTDETDIVLPESEKEREGKLTEARNPCVIALPGGGFRLYYSAGTVWLDDTDYEEPKYIFCAEAEHPLGPFVKRAEPILEPDPTMPFRNYGCGAIKVFGYKSGYLAFYNPIYLDAGGRSRSQIRMLASADGLSWEETPANPIVTPTEGWRKSIVYQLDIVEWKGDMLMYYNARDEWYGGIERIGCSRLTLAGEPGVRKLREAFRR